MTPPPPTKPTTARLLVVDDDENNRDMISRRLSRRGFDVDAAADGPAALAAVAAADAGGRPFDLVLLDIEMPGMSGFDVLRRVRETHPATQLPVVIATARHDREDVVQALGLGANDYVTKPIDFAVVLARVEAQLSHKRAVDRIVALEAEVRRQNDDLRQANARMRHSLQLAAGVQRSLLPRAARQQVGAAAFAWAFRPCDELGGDILNVFPLAGGHVGLYLLDVSGHGVPAALLSVSLSRVLVPIPGQASLVERVGADEKLEPRPPAEVVAELNQRFPMGAGGGQYFTIFYAVLDPGEEGRGTRRLRYVSAGHPPAVLVRDGEVRPLDGSGFAVGWFDDATFDEAAVDLSPGDRLFAYSDGVTETTDGGSASFGGGGLATALAGRAAASLAEAVDGVIAAVDAFRAGGPVLDDVTVLGMRVG